MLIPTMFSLQFGVGVLLGLVVIGWYTYSQGATSIGRWLDVGLGALLGGTLSARLTYVLLNWELFRDYPSDIWRIWYGGLSWHGALIGGLVGALVVGYWRHVPLLLMTDALALAFPLGLMSGWWACRRAGCGYGLSVSRETSGWISGYLPDTQGLMALRLEVQILGVWLGGLLLLIAIILTLKQWFVGRRLWLILFLTGVGMFIIGYLRGDPSPMVLNRRLDQNLDAIVMIVSAGIGIAIQIGGKRAMADDMILIVDDEQNIVELAGLYLKQDGFKVISAGDGKLGLELALNQNPSLVVLDLMLPQLDGWEVCKRIRAESDVPILMLTARDDDIDKIVGLELGADDYMTKPFNPRELVARVKAILRRVDNPARQATAQAIAIGNLRIDPASRTVTVEGRSIDLRTKEFDLLLTLMENKDIVLRRERLLDIVWGFDFYGQTRTIDVHVAHLRHKLEGSTAVIETVWGVGYKLTTS